MKILLIFLTIQAVFLTTYAEQVLDMPKYMTKNRLIAEKFLAASEADMKQNQQLQSNLKTNINLVCPVNKGMSLPECLKEYLAANPISDLFQIGLLPRNYVEILIQQKK